MGLKRFSATYRNKNVEHKASIGVFTWNSDGIYYAYSPSLDMTGYGDNKEEAIKSFEITFHEFVKYATNKKTLWDELEHLGWAVNKKKKKVLAPKMTEMLQDNEIFRDVFNKPGVEMVNKEVELVAA